MVDDVRGVLRSVACDGGSTLETGSPLVGSEEKSEAPGRCGEIFGGYRLNFAACVRAGTRRSGRQVPEALPKVQGSGGMRGLGPLAGEGQCWADRAHGWRGGGTCPHL
jgi:hypothetical protein